MKINFLSSSPCEIGLRNYVIEQNTKFCQDFLTVLFPQETISSFSLTFPHSLFCVSSKQGESNQKYWFIYDIQSMTTLKIWNTNKIGDKPRVKFLEFLIL